MTYLTRLPLVVATALSLGNFTALQTLRAQQPRLREVLRTPDGKVLDFAPDGGWRNQARAVAARRNALVARGDFSSLNARMTMAPGIVASPAACSPSTVVVCGVERIPAILFRFQDVGTGPTLPAGAGDTSKYTQILFGASPPAGRPYSIRTFYEQMSNNQLSLQGQVVGWFTLPGNEIQYTGDPATDGCTGNGTYCNGLFSSSAQTKMRNGLLAALGAADNGTFDWGQFDNDGPDGVPNSGDDNGYVDMVIFVHSEMDGACGGNNHLWSHRSQMSYTTQTPRHAPAVGNIRIRDYTLQAGVSGTTNQGCGGTNQIMAIGTAAHETGHAFGLPDLYDTDVAFTTQGIGQWGLMGSGNYTGPHSPSRMEAWSLQQLGWVTVRPITTAGTYSFGPAPTSDTTFMIRVQGTNPRGEYYLLENRQGSQADTAMIKFHCTSSGGNYPVNCHGGLAIWHIDSTKVKNAGFGSSNTVNGGGPPTKTNPHGVSIIQADGLNQLEKNQNRGNAGDVWPGYPTPNNNGYKLSTNPKAVANDSTTFIGFEIDQITQVVPDGEMSFRVQFGGVTVIAAADTMAKVKVDGIAYGRFQGLFADGSTHTITMDSPQLANGNRSQFTWVSWSDAGAQTHDITGSLAGATITATVATQYKVQATTSGSGTVASNPSVDLANGTFLDKNTTIQLTATPVGGGQLFDRWTGDTNSVANPLTLTMGKPYTLTASFVGPLAVSSAAPPDPVMGKGYSFAFTTSGGSGGNSWTVLSGTLPTGLTLSNAGVLSGTPSAAGSFSATLRVQSGAQTATTSVNLTVTEPTVALANALTHLLGTSGTGLTGDQVTYLDLIGNNNGSFDLGDFLAWVNRANVSPAPPVASRVLDEGETGGRVTP